MIGKKFRDKFYSLHYNHVYASHKEYDFFRLSLSIDDLLSECMEIDVIFVYFTSSKNDRAGPFLDSYLKFLILFRRTHPHAEK